MFVEGFACVRHPKPPLSIAMIVKRNLNLYKASGYVQYELALGLVVSVVVYLVYSVGGVTKVGIPNLLPPILGTAVAIFLGFRNQAAYSRWGEAGMLWASISNTSRVFSRLILTFVQSHSHTPTYNPDEAAAFQKLVIHRQIAWVHALRLELRGQEDQAEQVLKPIIGEADWEVLSSKSNKPSALLLQQGHAIYDAMRSGTLQGFDSFQLEGCLAQLSGFQAQCERIKHIPIPRQYTFFTRLFVWFFIITIPFCFVDTLGRQSEAWVVIPITVLLAFVFGIGERTGAVNEDPFENLITDVPLTAVSVDVERDLREMLQEAVLPEKLKPVKGFLF